MYEKFISEVWSTWNYAVELLQNWMITDPKESIAFSVYPALKSQANYKLLLFIGTLKNKFLGLSGNTASSTLALICACFMLQDRLIHAYICDNRAQNSIQILSLMEKIKAILLKLLLLIWFDLAGALVSQYCTYRHAAAQYVSAFALAPLIYLIKIRNDGLWRIKNGICGRLHRPKQSCSPVAGLRGMDWFPMSCRKVRRLLFVIVNVDKQQSGGGNPNISIAAYIILCGVAMEMWLDFCKLISDYTNPSSLVFLSYLNVT